MSYPLNPVCARADDAFYRELIDFAKKNQIIVVHDAAYSDIAFGDEPYPSFLSFPGAKDIGVEFYSLSKTYNFTGARLAFLLGNERIVQALHTIRSQIDYGVFLPIQKAGIAALTGDQYGVKARCRAYQEMATQLTEGLAACGWPIKASQGTMFLWTKLPYGYKNSLQFTLDLMEQQALLHSDLLWRAGEGHVRFALRTIRKFGRGHRAISSKAVLERLKLVRMNNRRRKPRGNDYRMIWVAQTLMVLCSVVEQS